ncbi:MAG TPA: hypothetical protein VMZ22_00400 [Acidimicrobiales bacterium]|nr:hypothetical protein [Acidimicrobiales bacterium]
MTDWPQDPPPEPPSELEPHSEEAAAADDLHAAPPPPPAPPPAPLWQSTPREPDAEVVASEPQAPLPPEPEQPEQLAAELTDPTEWFDPPPVEPVTVADDYKPPTNDGSGFVSAHTMVTRPADVGEKMAFSVENLSSDDRRALSTRLTEADVSHYFDGPTTLIGRVEDATAVQGHIDDLLGGDEEIDEVIEEADADEDEIVFDLASLSIEERRHLGMRLTGAGISHIWEVGTDLVVAVADAPVIETYVEEVRNPDGFGDEEVASLEGGSEVDDEAIYSAMSNLYVAADKLMQKPADEATAGAFYLAADDVDGLPAPFGFDPRVWSEVLALTSSITSALDAESDPEPIGAQARTLREILVNYV